MRLLTALLIGALFGTGISFAGMANPAKVLNFFDLAGAWDPSLALVMAGALAVTAPGYRLLFARGRPRFAPGFQLPTGRRIDRPLVLGALTFGIGWGIAGFCPGGALPTLGILAGGAPAGIDVLIFVLALLAGIILARRLRRA